jgi:hypothetical protein
MSGVEENYTGAQSEGESGGERGASRERKEGRVVKTSLILILSLLSLLVALLLSLLVLSGPLLSHLQKVRTSLFKLHLSTNASHPKNGILRSFFIFLSIKNQNT